ncbi:hypothetical protein OXPF_27130 [Oxobacter pfennigii]|uniref:Uncharacterized protein n=1 Tax=Oxobacter pfennigii TaxID=36849 RepID=A0A0N8NSX8_9CLOT|nr:hypothetical protein [Oxobacter pfennigii]KPU43272.1 hypothetical protein OXPF_27130 [Oxobacter pfennigii]
MNYKRIFYTALLIIILLINSVSCTIRSKKEEYNQVIQSWLVDNIQNADSYNLGLSLVTVYNHNDKRPENIPESVVSDYEIDIFKSEKKARIVEKEGIIKKTSYLSIEGDKVIIYKSTDNGFEKKVYQDAQLAEAMSKIVFPDDISIFNGEVVLSGIASDGIKSLTVQRYVDGEPFYHLYYLVTGEKQKEKNIISLGFSYSTLYKKMRSLRIDDTGILYKSIYYLLNGSQYENIYTKNNVNYDQELVIYFTGLITEDFELPEVK